MIFILGLFKAGSDIEWGVHYLANKALNCKVLALSLSSNLQSLKSILDLVVQILSLLHIDFVWACFSSRNLVVFLRSMLYKNTSIWVLAMTKSEQIQPESDWTHLWSSWWKWGPQSRTWPLQACAVTHLPFPASFLIHISISFNLGRPNNMA